MPSMPVSLWNDPSGERMRSTYFDTYPDTWRQGDCVTITSHGSIIIDGRSDATLNRKGVRLGSAEIYEIIESVDGVRESLVVGVDLPDCEYWMPLFIALDAETNLDDAIIDTIRDRLKLEASPRHVPDEISVVPNIPHTRTGKKLELEVPVKGILAGTTDPSTVLSVEAIDDPHSLDAFIELARMRPLTSMAEKQDAAASVQASSSSPQGCAREFAQGTA